MHHLQEDEHWHGEDEPIPVDEPMKSGLLPDDYEEFLPDEWRDDEAVSTEEATYAYVPEAQLTDSQEDAAKSMHQEELENILDELNKEQFNAPKLCFTIRKAVTNALRKFPHAEVRDLFPKSKPQLEPQPVPKRKPNEVSNIADHRKPGWEIVRYDKDAQMYQFSGGLS